MRNQFIFCFIFLFVFFIRAQQEPSLTLQTGHSANFRVALSPDGKSLVSGGADKLVLLWDIKKGRHFAPLEGHSSLITDIVWDSDNQHFYTCDYVGKLIKWNKETRQQVASFFKLDSTLLRMTFIAAKQQLVVVSKDSMVRVFDTKLNVLRKVRFAESSPISVSYCKADATDLLMITCRDSSLRILSLDNLETLTNVKSDELIYETCFNNNFSRVVLNGSSKKIHLCSFPDMKPIAEYETEHFDFNTSGEYSEVATVYTGACFYKDTLLAFGNKSNALTLARCGVVKDPNPAEYEESNEWGIVTQVVPVPGSTKLLSVHVAVRMQTWEMKEFWDSKESYVSKAETKMHLDMCSGFCSSASGERLLISGTPVHEYSFKDGTSTARQISGSAYKFPARYLPDDQRVLIVDVATEKKLKIYNTSLSKPDAVVAFSEPINAYNISALSNCIYVAYHDNYLQKLSASDLSLIKADSASAGKKFIVNDIAESPDGNLIALVCGATIRITDAKTLKTLKVLNPPVDNEFYSCFFSADSKQLITSFLAGGEARRYDVNSGKEIKSFSFSNSDVVKIIADKGRKNFIAADYDYILRIVDAESGKILKALPPMTGNLLDYQLTQDNKYLLVLNESHIIEVYTYPALEKQLNIAVVREQANDIPFTDDNFYTGGKFHSQLLSMTENKIIYPIEQYDVLYNRPDKILSRTVYGDSALIGLYKLAFEKRSKKYKTGFVPVGKRPQAEVLNAESISEIVYTKEFTLKVKCTAREAGLKELRVHVNKIPVIVPVALTTKPHSSSEISITIPLQNGDNYIEIDVADLAGVESQSEILKIKRIEELNFKQNLYIICAGVSRYKQENYSLRYAAKDAADLCEALGNDTALYGKTYRMVLKDSMVTKQSLVKMKEFLKSARENDVVIIFMAGHGVLNTQLDYFFAAYDLDFANPEKAGITLEEIEEVMKSAKPFRKLLIMDSCHSGELNKEDVQKTNEAPAEGGAITFRAAGAALSQQDKNKQTSRLMNKMFTELNSASGTNILTATAGADFAMESDAYRNGLFTYCFIQGIKTLEADLNKDGRIPLEEMIYYLRQKVSQLSKGEQEPNTRYENEYTRFRIW